MDSRNFTYIIYNKISWKHFCWEVRPCMAFTRCSVYFFSEQLVLRESAAPSVPDLAAFIVTHIIRGRPLRTQSSWYIKLTDTRKDHKVESSWKVMAHGDAREGKSIVELKFDNLLPNRSIKWYERTIAHTSFDFLHVF